MNALGPRSLFTMTREIFEPVVLAYTPRVLGEAPLTVTVALFGPKYTPFLSSREYHQSKVRKDLPSVEPVGESDRCEGTRVTPVGSCVHFVFPEDSQGVGDHKASSDIVVSCTGPFTNGELGAWVIRVDQSTHPRDQLDGSLVGLVVLGAVCNPRFVDVGSVLGTSKTGERNERPYVPKDS